MDQLAGFVARFGRTFELVQFCRNSLRDTDTARTLRRLGGAVVGAIGEACKAARRFYFEGGIGTCRQVETTRCSAEKASAL
jgi:hypothetical protein